MGKRKAEYSGDEAEEQPKRPATAKKDKTKSSDASSSKSTPATSQSQRKKLDARIPALISHGVAHNTRSLFVLVGDHGRDHVPTLHFLLSKARHTARPSVLWCYKKDLGFSSHRKKRMKQIQREIKKGTRDVDEEDPFELFVGSTDIRYAYYKESQKILGNTYGMLVLQVRIDGDLLILRSSVFNALLSLTGL